MGTIRNDAANADERGTWTSFACPGGTSAGRRAGVEEVEKLRRTHDTASMDRLVELLDRQTDFLQRHGDAREFLIEVEAFLSALQTDPLLTAYLEDALQDLADIVEVMEQTDAALSSELIELRNELVALRPDADDSDVEPRTGSTPADRTERARYELTLAFFDECARAEAPAFNADGEGGRATTLLSILQAKDSESLREREMAVSASDVATEASAGGSDPSTGEETPAGDDEMRRASDPVDRWRRRLGNVQRRYDHALRSMKLRVRTSAGLALLKLEAANAAVNPEPTLLDVDEDSVRAASDLLRWVQLRGLFAVQGGLARTARRSRSADHRQASP
jgi:hypothetical protein